jgi:D-amino-acid oxidase
MMEETYEEFIRLADSDPTTGIKFMKGIEYFDNPPDTYTSLMKELKYCEWPEFRVILKDKLPWQGRGSIQWGTQYEAWCVNTLVYLPWLIRQLTLRGAKIVKRNLSSIQEAVFVAREEHKIHDLKVEAVINASGMGFGDQDCYPSRGQYILLANGCNRTISWKDRDGVATVIIPRPLGGGTLVGGTTEPNNW